MQINIKEGRKKKNQRKSFKVQEIKRKIEKKEATKEVTSNLLYSNYTVINVPLSIKLHHEYPISIISPVYWQNHES